jgi:P4 family phage/plasmid primase-like protien
MEEFIFTEMSDARNSVFKKIEVLPDGSLVKTAKATISEGTAKTMVMGPNEFKIYLESLSKRSKTCIVPTIWDGGVDYEEFDICLDGKEKPEDGVVSRTKKFFKYANSDHISFAVFDIDGNYPLEEVHRFIDKLETVLKDAIITATGKKKLMRFEKPSASAGVRVKGKPAGTGLHVWIPVRNMTGELIKQIFRWAWLTEWPAHDVTAAVTVIPLTIIDGTVGAQGRLFFESDAEVTGCLELVEIVERKCDYYPGGVLDCELALGILIDKTCKYDSNWNAYKAKIEREPGFVEKRRQYVAAEKARREELGRLAAQGQPDEIARMDRLERESSFASKLLFEDRVILSSDFLTTSNGEQISVYDILVDRDSYLGRRGFLDPIKPKVGTNKAMISGNEHGVSLKSFAHGGLYYYLRFDIKGLEKWAAEAETDELLQCAGSFAAQTVGTEAAIGGIIKKIAKSASTTVAEVKKDRAIASTKIVGDKMSDEIELQIEQSGEIANGTEIAQIGIKSTHGEIAEDMLRSLGQCRAYGSSFYVGDKDIWRLMRVEVLEERISMRYKFCELCRRGSDYKSITNLVFNKEEAYCPDWKSHTGIPCASQFLSVGPAEVGEMNGRQVKGAGWIKYSLDLGARFKLGFNPDWEMKTPYWQKVLDNVVNVRCFQQAFGLALCGYLTKEIGAALVMFGEGGTGKGTTNRVLTEMLPRGRVTAVSIEQMSHRTDCIPLVDSVINIIPEIRNSRKAQITEGFKKATGGDMMQAHRMYKGDVAFTPIATQVININQWPVLDSSGEELRRRLGLFIVEFKKNHAERIDGLVNLIAERELPGVLAWAIDGITDFFENGADSEHSARLFERWIGSFDPIEGFLSECVVRGEGVIRSTLWKVFKKYCEDSGWYVPDKGVFNEEIIKRFCQATLDEGVYIYKKIALSEEGSRIAKGLGLKFRRKSTK